VLAAPIREPLLHLADGMSVMGVQEICDEKWGWMAVGIVVAASRVLSRLRAPTHSQSPRMSGAPACLGYPAEMKEPTLRCRLHAGPLLEEQEVGHSLLLFVNVGINTLYTYASEKLATRRSPQKRRSLRRTCSSKGDSRRSSPHAS